jgi:hypothetical protein
LILLVLIFEWRVFENRILNGSIFRIPLCGIALYGLAFSILFKNEKAYKIFYFYAFEQSSPISFLIPYGDLIDGAD